MNSTKKKVLVVEDSRLVREAIRMALEVNGFEVITACDGVEGLSIAEKELPDEIVMDWNLPKLQGKALVHMLHIGAKTSAIPIIVMSASSKAELGEYHATAQAKDHLKKDSFVLERLVNALQQQVPALV